MAKQNEQSLEELRRARVLQVEVLTPEKTIFEGEVLAVTATNSVGVFSILPQHANFVSLITGKLLLHTDRRQAQELNVERGVLFCRNNKVAVYVGITSPQQASVLPAEIRVSERSRGRKR